MSNEKKETIADIVADIRAQNQGLPEDSYALSPLVCDLLSFADRIEAAANRQFREVTKMIPHEEVDVSKMETTTPTGNTAAMREALEAAIPIMRACLFDYYNTTDVKKVVGEMKAALSAPPRNCDVGTAEEQARRYEELCDSHTCGSICSGSGCPLYACDCSPFAWAQMPYEEADVK